MDNSTGVSDKREKNTDWSGEDERARLISNGSEEPSLKSLWSSTTTKHKMLLVYLACGRLSTNFCACAPAPFLARVVHKRGGTMIHATLIMQIMQVTMAFTCCLFGKYQRSLGCKLLFFSGVVLYGTCQVAFGFIEFINDFDSLIVCAVLIKALQGVGLGAYTVALITIICQEFFADLWLVFAIIELAFGIGYFLGPLIGGIFFTLSGGLLLPCVTSGLIILLSCSSGVILLRGFVQDDSENPEYNIVQCIFNGSSFLFLGCAVAVFGCFGIFDVAFTIYLAGLQYTVMSVGIIMFTSTILYCPSVVFAWYINRIPKWLRIFLLTISLCAMTVNSLLFSAYALEGVIYGAAIILRFLGGFVLVLAFNEFFTEMMLLNSNLRQSFGLYIAKLRIWTIVIGIGSFVIPIACSIAVEELNFSLSMLISVGSGFLTTAIMAILLHLLTLCRKPTTT